MRTILVLFVLVVAVASLTWLFYGLIPKETKPACVLTQDQYGQPLKYKTIALGSSSNPMTREKCEQWGGTFEERR